MDVIIPCAGLSTRFPDMKPKYLLEDADGKLMIELAIGELSGHRISIVVLKEHVEKYDAHNLLTEKFGNSINLIVLEKRTKGPADTVFQALLSIQNADQFLVRDCDSSFNCQLESGNYVFVYPTKELDLQIEKKSLGHVFSKDGVIEAISEKSLLSDLFCVGGYQFNSKKDFFDAYLACSDVYGEIYLSHVINASIGMGCEFRCRQATNYKNFGNLELWQIHNTK